MYWTAILLALYGSLASARAQVPKVVKITVTADRAANDFEFVAVSEDGGKFLPPGPVSPTTADTLHATTPTEFTADLSGGSVAFISPDDSTWLRVDVDRPDGRGRLSASAARVVVGISNGRWWVRCAPHSPAKW